MLLVLSLNEQHYSNVNVENCDFHYYALGFILRKKVIVDNKNAEGTDDYIRLQQRANTITYEDYGKYIGSMKKKWIYCRIAQSNGG